MQKLIDGKLYDTNEAELIASWSTFQDKRDFNFFEEKLYRTESGAWFLYGSGGASSKYSQPAASGGMTGGEDIRPLSESEVFEWCERRNQVEVALEYFPDMVEPA